MKKTHTLFLLFFLFINTLSAQKQPLNYYLPDISYDKNVPTPEQFLGWQIGEWHISHDQLVYYMRALAAASDRVTIEETGRTYEDRPLLQLVITSPRNHGRLDEIKQQHLDLTDPAKSANLDVAKMPVVVWQGYSIHGNESSGSNAAPLVAYYLAAGKSKEVEQLLDEMVVLFDPCYNPDGLNRFASWVNSRKSKNLVADPQSQEFNEPWPRGRTNHYWFDLNRDWLPAIHPESQARIRKFQEWHPNILTDHHEMGSNSTFFFQPGVPQRTNPITPQINQDLTAKIGEYHAAALDEIGSTYFSAERFDDYYYGKGSTYPDVNGCIGILFEQGSSRGHAQESINGVLTFPFTVKNQVETSLSTLKAGQALRTDLLNMKRDFYTSAMSEAKRDNRKAFVVKEVADKARLQRFAEMMQRHQIDVRVLGKDIKVNGKEFPAEHSLIVPMEQQQYRLIRAIFEQPTTFKDSLFYDVSAWTLPLAFNFEFAAVERGNFASDLLGIPFNEQRLTPIKLPEMSKVGYLLKWENYYAPNALNRLLDNGLRVKVASESFELNGENYAAGTIFIASKNQDQSAEEVHQLVKDMVAQHGVEIQSVNTGLTKKGIDLGSNDFLNVKQPKVALVVGGGASGYDAGEVWHLLDQRMDMEVSMLEQNRIGMANLSRYNVLIMVTGGYSDMGKNGVDKIKKWVQNDGTLIVMRDAITWAKTNGLAKVEIKKGETPKTPARRPYTKRGADFGSNVIGGAIFETKMDMTHPLTYGFQSETLPVFRRGTLFLQPSKNAYATPIVYTDQPLMAGYISAKNLEILRNSAAVVVSGVGRGKTICLADNPNFRAFWYGTNRLMMNSIFFGQTISGGAIER